MITIQHACCRGCFLRQVLLVVLPLVMWSSIVWDDHPQRTTVVHSFITTSNSNHQHVRNIRKEFPVISSPELSPSRFDVLRLQPTNECTRLWAEPPVSSSSSSSSTPSPPSSLTTSEKVTKMKASPPRGIYPDTHDGGDGEEEDDDDEEDEYEREERRRQHVIDQFLKKEELAYREERRRMVWGEFANATTKEEIAKIEQSIKKKIAAENERKAKMAQLQGVQLEILDLTEKPRTERVFEEGDIQIRLGSESREWHHEMDEDLKKEWKALEGDGTDFAADGTNYEFFANEDGLETVEVDGKIVARDTLKGVRVGSAGGWTLEVFPGDFVVHRKYGIGRFEKTILRPRAKLTEQEIEAQNARRAEILAVEMRKIKGGATPAQVEEIRSRFGTDADTDPISNPQSTVLEITYADGVVHVPVDRAYRLSRYRGGDCIVKPRLSKMRGNQWRLARKKVEDNTLELAQDVLALYATRETLQRQPFDPAKENEVKEFEKTFRFEPTKDQARCFEDVENDMVWRSRPMDRLICGDVGFGKTEVAIRALYRAVVNGRQGAFLAPTGVLASQHYKTLVNRMGEGTIFNKRIALLRGGMTKSSKAGRALRQQIKNGEFDIIVGTHALLGNDLEYKDLGLLVVDEEQRFGVQQKERLKIICGGIDVLTLSATPIPRTLQMSLSGVRDTSTIRSPPPMRIPTKTFVQDYNKDIIKFALSQEMERGGQCFYVVPRIKMLNETETMINECFPDLRVIRAHGQMGRNTAEENVAAFAEGNYDVLLATTVIENGVDIPRVNTIIVQDSQYFGVSTLYQLRGRVGRSDQQGFAFFLHNEALTEQSLLRLEAIGVHSQLGSGFDIANRDLEIRGAGSLLGTEQSGMAAKVGFDLYMRMLKKSIRQLNGLDLPLVPRTNILLPKGEGGMEVRKRGDNGEIVSVHAFQIPESYIPDNKERQSAETAARLAESSAKLVTLTSEWKEKYGNLPMALQVKLKTMHLHACTRRLGIDLVGLIDNGNGRIDCVLRSPGLRPRHWGMILPMLPKEVAPRGLDVVFPARFTRSGDDQEIQGGKRIDLKALLEDPSLDDDSDRWDALDEEDVEAMKDIASAYDVKSMDEVDIEQYPRFVIKDFGTEPKAVDRLLKVLLPVAKVVFEKQEVEKDHAKVAAELRGRTELLQRRKKENEQKEMQKSFLPGVTF